MLLWQLIEISTKMTKTKIEKKKKKKKKKKWI